MSRDVELAHRAQALTPAPQLQSRAIAPRLCQHCCHVPSLAWGWAGAVSQLLQFSPCSPAALPALGARGGFLTRFWEVGGRTCLHLLSLQGQSSCPRNPGQLVAGWAHNSHGHHKKWGLGAQKLLEGVAKAWEGLEVQVMIWEEMQQGLCVLESLLHPHFGDLNTFQLCSQ